MQASVERWQTMLSSAAEAMEKDEALAKLIGGRSALDKKVDGIRKALQTDFSPAEANLFKMLIDSGDLSMAHTIASSLGDVMSGAQAPLKAEVTSAAQLTKEEQEELRKKLISQYGEGLIFEFHVDEALLGGLRIRVGDKLTDMSVASRLNAMRDRLASAVR
jgi:F-type H+-transporting ATPase subunit delta